MNKELVIVKIAKKKVEGVRYRGGVGVRVDANDELKLGNMQKEEEKNVGMGFSLRWGVGGG